MGPMAPTDEEARVALFRKYVEARSALVDVERRLADLQLMKERRVSEFVAARDTLNQYVDRVVEDAGL